MLRFAGQGLTLAGCPLHDIEHNKTDGDDRREDGNRERPINMASLTPRREKCHQRFEPGLAHAASVSSKHPIERFAKLACLGVAPPFSR